MLHHKLAVSQYTQSYCGRIMERLLRSQIQNYLHNKNLIKFDQCNFRIIDLVEKISFFDYLTKEIDQGQIRSNSTDAVYFKHFKSNRY